MQRVNHFMFILCTGSFRSASYVWMWECTIAWENVFNMYRIWFTQQDAWHLEKHSRLHCFSMIQEWRNIEISSVVKVSEMSKHLLNTWINGHVMNSEVKFSKFNAIYLETYAKLVIPSCIIIPWALAIECTWKTFNDI